MYKFILQRERFRFVNLKNLLAKATPLRSGDRMAKIAAKSQTEFLAAQYCLADVFITDFYKEEFIPYSKDEVSKLIINKQYNKKLNELESMTIGELRNWLLSSNFCGKKIRWFQNISTPELVAAVSKIMRNQDLIKVAKKINNITQFNNTIGLLKRFSSRLQPNHPTDDFNDIFKIIFQGLMKGCGDALIGINPAQNNFKNFEKLIYGLNHLLQTYKIPTQHCILCHLKDTLKLMKKKLPIQLLFQSISGTQKSNENMGITISLVSEAAEMSKQLAPGIVGNNRFYFETGQGSCLSANAHWGVDQQTLEARAYFLAQHFNPFLVNSVVGFIGPEYLMGGAEILRACLEDNFCGKLLGLNMGVDICYTFHNNVNLNDLDSMLILLATAGCSFIMGVPNGDDIMLNYQTTSFEDVQYIRDLLNLKPAPEFEVWLKSNKIWQLNKFFKKSFTTYLLKNYDK